MGLFLNYLHIHHWPSRVLCLSLVLLQALALDYHLVKTKSLDWAVAAVGDLTVAIVFIAAFALATDRAGSVDENGEEAVEITFLNWDTGIYNRPMSFICWGMYGGLMAFKLAIICDDVQHLNDEIPYLGPNLLKFTFGMTSIIFILFMETQHVVKPDTTARVYIASMVGSAPFDILDGVNAVTVIFSTAKRSGVGHNVQEAIIAVCCIDFLLPTIHLATVSASKFGLNPLHGKLVLAHKIFMKTVVNLPLLLLRSILWARYGQDASVFVIKNISAMGLLIAEVYQNPEVWKICQSTGNDVEKGVDNPARQDSVYSIFEDNEFSDARKASDINREHNSCEDQRAALNAHERRMKFVGTSRLMANRSVRMYQASVFQ